MSRRKVRMAELVEGIIDTKAVLRTLSPTDDGEQYHELFRQLVMFEAERQEILRRQR